MRPVLLCLLGSMTLALLHCVGDDPTPSDLGMDASVDHDAAVQSSTDAGGSSSGGEPSDASDAGARGIGAINAVQVPLEGDAGYVSSVSAQFYDRPLDSTASCQDEADVNGCHIQRCSEGDGGPPVIPPTLSAGKITFSGGALGQNVIDIAPPAYSGHPGAGAPLFTTDQAAFGVTALGAEVPGFTRSYQPPAPLSGVTTPVGGPSNNPTPIDPTFSVSGAYAGIGAHVLFALRGTGDNGLGPSIVCNDVPVDTLTIDQSLLDALGPGTYGATLVGTTTDRFPAGTYDISVTLATTRTLGSFQIAQ